MSINGLTFDQYPLGTGGPDAERRIAALALTTFEGDRAFWAPGIEQGDALSRAIAGEFFTAAMKAEMKDQHKVAIEIAEGWPKYAAMVGVAILSMKSGGILPQGPEDSMDAKGAQIVSKCIDNEVDMATLKALCVADAFATGCPQFTILDRPVKNLDGKTMAAYRPHYKAGYLDPLCRDLSRMSDCRRISFQHLLSKEDLLRRYPHRRSQVEEAFKGVSDSRETLGQGLTVEQRDTLFAAVQSGNTEVETMGRIHVIEIFSMIARRVTVYVSPYSEQMEVLDHLDDAGRQKWIAENPSYQPIETEVDILWVTTVTMNGQVLENGAHWFQEGIFPVAALVLQWHGEKPVSPLKFAAANWKLQAIAKTEHIHSIRLATDNLTLVREGSVKNEEDLDNELARPGGRIVIKRGIPLAEALYRVPNQREQMAWADLFAEAQMTNDRMTVDRNLEGGSQSSQEAAKVVQLRVSQMQNKTAMSQKAINTFARNIERIKLAMLPYLVTEETEFRYIDEKNGRSEVKSVVANKVVEYDPLGNPLRLANRLDIAKYDLVETETDDSPTGREAELTSFVAIMQNVMANVPPEFWGPVFAEIPNSITQRISDGIKAKEEAQASQPEKPPVKITGTIDASKLAYDPIAQAVAKLAGVLPQDFQAPAAQPPQAAAAPAATPSAPMPTEPTPEGVAP